MQAHRRFEILGPLRVFTGNQPVQITAGKSKVVLGALLIHANRLVAADRLIEYMWEEPPSSARAIMHSAVLRLRRALGNPDLIRTVGSEYLIELGPGELDLDDFYALLDQAEKARGREDAIAERDFLARALDLWRGAVLNDVPSPVLRHLDAMRLEEHRLRALSRRIDLDLAAQQHDRLVSELRLLTREHPFKEGFWGQLMTALYRCGRRAEALAAYQEVRGILADELGIDPGGELQDLHRAMLNAAPSLETSPKDVPAAVDSWRTLRQLPLAVDDFAGRRADKALVTEHLATDRARIAVIWGPPGVGKTALAVHVAHSLAEAYPDGQWYIPLHGSSESPADPGEVIVDLLVASGVPPATIPRGLAGRAAALRARLAGRRVLLVLDDVDDLEQIEPLLPGTAGNGVLVTSRSARSELPGAVSHRLAPLPRAAAVAMLARIIGEDRVRAEGDAAAEIADLCGGMPLALRIVGSRLQPQPTLALDAMANRLRSERRRLDELAVGNLTVRAELEVSHQDLDHDAQTAFRRMGLLPYGDFAAWPLGLLASDDDGAQRDGLRLAEQLTKAGLLEPADGTGRPRHRAHDLVGLFARELAEQEDPASTRAALDRLLDTLVCVGSIVYQHTPRFLEGMTPDHVPAAAAPRSVIAEVMEDPDAWVHRERRLLLTTMEQASRVGRHRKAALLATLVVPTLAGMGGFSSLVETLTVISNAAFEAGDERVGWRVEYGRASLWLTSHLDRAVLTFSQCAQAFERMNATSELAHSLSGLAFARSRQGDYDEESVGRAVELARGTHDSALQALTLRRHADVLAAKGDHERACELYGQALQHCRGHNTASVESDILLRYGASALAQDDLAAALAACERAVTLVAEKHQGNRLGQGLSLRSGILLATGKPLEAIEVARQAHALMSETDDVRGAASAAVTLAQAYLAVDRRDEAVSRLEEAIPELRASGSLLDGFEAGRLLRDARSGLTSATGE